MKRPIRIAFCIFCTIGYMVPPHCIGQSGEKDLFTFNLSAFEKEHALVKDQPLASDSCTLHIQPEHMSVRCEEARSTTCIRKPQVVSACGSAVSLSFSDELFELGCGVHGFTGYFHLSRWKNVKIYGDDGVDVTGAPDSKLLVEGTDNTLVVVNRGRGSGLSITSPSCGYIYFSWKLNGSSIITPSEASPLLLVNGMAFEPTYQNNQIVSPYLEQGDVLEVYTPIVLDGHFTLTDFAFFTNSQAVVVRNWRITLPSGLQGSFDQYISLEKPDLSHLQMPENTVLAIPNGQDIPHSTSPIQTGFPSLDARNLENLGCSNLKMNWSDEWQSSEEGLTLTRHWSLTDQATANTWISQQKIDVIPLLKDGFFHGFTWPEKGKYRLKTTDL